MKRVLITGANSYIGTAVEKYLTDHQYLVDTVDMMDASWREKDFVGYDTVYHVAGIAHADTGRVSEERKAQYYKINTDLAEETARKAKEDGVRQFIFMSSAIVYGDSAPIGCAKRIVSADEAKPANFYGDSKFQAEKKILAMESEHFSVVILRPPMIYGKNSKGNYPVLAKLAKKLPVFPAVRNERSMLYIENLCEFVRLMIANEEKGLFHPQNAEYSNTSELVKLIAHAHGRKILLIPGFGWALKLLSHLTGLVNKAFGSMSYDMALSEYKEDYRVCGLYESIERTEKQGHEESVNSR